MIQTSLTCTLILSLSGLHFQSWYQTTPLEVQTVFINGTSQWTRGSYSSINECVGTGTITTIGGSSFLFKDEIVNLTDTSFSIVRSVTIIAKGADEIGFSTQFSLFAPQVSQSRHQFFIPGISYQNISSLPPNALAANPNASYILIREDRLPLPFVLVFYPDNKGSSMKLVHLYPNGSTIPNEDYTTRIIDADLQFGSLGFININNNVLNDTQLSIAFQYPGTEGDRTYIGGGIGGWANRSHPIDVSVLHEYSLQFSYQFNSASFYETAKNAWRETFNLFTPVLSKSPSQQQIYRDGMEVLASYGISYSNVPSMPFEVSLPNGVVIDTSSQAGFVGRALPSAALLLFDAVVISPNITRQQQAEAIIDLWAKNAILPCGVMRTWYNIESDGNITWRTSPSEYQGSLRIMSDGMKGMIDSWTVLQKDIWLAASVLYGNFLVQNQAKDGSILAAWTWSCMPISNDTRQTSFIIPFLVSLYSATKDMRYYSAALLAGTFAASLFNETFSYEGGAVDNPDVADKESGWLSAQAFLSLYDLTSNPFWLYSAAQAATYAETFVYSWNIPIQCIQEPLPVYPCKRTTLGASLIATGQSGADNYMSIATFDYKRLGKLLDDDHFLIFSDFLKNATTQVLDYDDSLSYSLRGLMTEAVTFSVRRGSGIKDWLPWLTANLLTPLVQQMKTSNCSTLLKKCL